MSINTDGNLASLHAYERAQDRLQRMDDMLEEEMNRIWDTPALLVQAIREASGLDQVDDAIEKHAKRILAERKRDR
jgi:putative protein kinase ArgK-like GTPase of G3E family